MEGYIGFTNSKSWISDVINWFQKLFWSSKPKTWSHVFRTVGTLGSHPMVAESQIRGRRTTPLASYLDKETELELWAIEGISSDKHLQATDRFLEHEDGKAYGYLSLVGFIWVGICKILGRKVKNPFPGDAVCSEVVSKDLIVTGYYNSTAVDPDNITPNDIYEHFVEDYQPLMKARKVAVSPFGSDQLEWLE